MSFHRNFDESQLHGIYSSAQLLLSATSFRLVKLIKKRLKRKGIFISSIMIFNLMFSFLLLPRISHLISSYLQKQQLQKLFPRLLCKYQRLLVIVGTFKIKALRRTLFQIHLFDWKITFWLCPLYILIFTVRKGSSKFR